MSIELSFFSPLVTSLLQVIIPDILEIHHFLWYFKSTKISVRSDRSHLSVRCDVICNFIHQFWDISHVKILKQRNANEIQKDKSYTFIGRMTDYLTVVASLESVYFLTSELRTLNPSLCLHHVSLIAFMMLNSIVGHLINISYCSYTSLPSSLPFLV